MNDLTGVTPSVYSEGMTNTTDTTAVQSVLNDEVRAIIRTGDLKQILGAITTVQPTADVAEITPALPVAITANQQAAIEALPSVYGKVVPTTKRTLSQSEIEALYTERKALDELEKLAKVRRESIRTAIVNHLDESIDDTEGLEQDADGHYLYAQLVRVPTQSENFSWEIRQAAASLDADALAELDREGKIDHELYLSMTTQVRVVDEMKVMAAIQTQPAEALEAIAQATRPGKTTGALYVRKAK